MLFSTDVITKDEIKNIRNFFEQYDREVITVSLEEEEQNQKDSVVAQYITSLVSHQYEKSVEEIENTKVGNKILRKKNLQQVMKESFFYGANRFGNNFIA